MAQQQWFVVRGGKETGPYSGTQLKDMAATGKLKPTDQVRRADVETARPASAIKGLFEPVKAPRKPPPDVQPRQAASRSDPDAPSGATTPFWKHPALIAVSLIFCFPVGLVLVWLRNDWPTNKKLAWSGVTLAVWVPLIVFSQIEAKKTRNEVAAAHQQWDAGNKVPAVATYRKHLDRVNLLDKRDGQLLLGRLIDFECEAGNIESAKSLIAEAEKKGVLPTVNHPEAKTILAAAQAAALQPTGSTATATKGDVLTADFYPHQPGIKQQVIGPLYIAKGQAARFRKEYSHEKGGLIVVRWLRNAGPQGQDLPIPKSRKLQHRQKAGFIEIGEENEVLIQTVWHPVVKLGAKVGDEWEREVIPGVTEQYKLVGFGEPKWGLKEIDFDGSGKKGKILAARIEVRIVSDLGSGKTLVDTEEIELGQGIGLVSRQSFRGEKEGRQTNWTETLVKPQKN